MNVGTIICDSLWSRQYSRIYNILEILLIITLTCMLIYIFDVVHTSVFKRRPCRLRLVDTNVEEHRSLGGSIISRLDNGAFNGLIYELLVFSQFHVEVVPPVTTHPLAGMLGLPNLTKLEGKEVIPNMGLLSLLHYKLEDDAWYCNLLHFMIQVPNNT